MDEAIKDILYTFSLDEHHANFEQLSAEGKVIDHPRVRTLNPGHTLECLWFCLDECRRLGRTKDIERAIEVADWTWQRGLDRDMGGIFSYLDLYGGEPAQMAYHKIINQRWDDKCWWVHSETLVTLAMAATLTKDPKWMERFMLHHEYCQKAFYAPQYGQWYLSLRRDGRPTSLNHAEAWNEAYHLPRALLYVMETFENAAK
jgi:N-acylglucosamine 2-epimerase